MSTNCFSFFHETFSSFKEHCSRLFSFDLCIITWELLLLLCMTDVVPSCLFYLVQLKGKTLGSVLWMNWRSNAKIEAVWSKKWNFLKYMPKIMCWLFALGGEDIWLICTCSIQYLGSVRVCLCLCRINIAYFRCCGSIVSLVQFLLIFPLF